MVKKTMEEAPDLRPEYCTYHDEGCQFSASCLHCSLSRCVEELPLGRQKQSIESRNREIIRLYNLKKKNVKELAYHFNITVRTVERVLKGHKEQS